MIPVSSSVYASVRSGLFFSSVRCLSNIGAFQGLADSTHLGDYCSPSYTSTSLTRFSSPPPHRHVPAYGPTGHVRGFAASSAATAATQPITIHESAVRRLRELQRETPDSPVVLRIEVEGGGCSGFQYRFALDSQVNSDDIVTEVDTARVVCDNVSLQFLQGSTVEWEDSLMRSAFTVSHNPNSDSSCGCGSSFTAKMR